MIVVDTSAWIEFLRRTERPVARTLHRLIERETDIAVTEIIVTELLAGARPEQLARLRSRLLSFPVLRLEGLADFEEAALVYRACRDAGETVRSITDCLVAVPAMRAGAQLLHRDADFDTIARHTALRIYAAGRNA